MEKYYNGPYKDIPQELLKDFTLNKQIPIIYQFVDESNTHEKINWDLIIQKYLDNFTPQNFFSNNIGPEVYAGASKLLFESFYKYFVNHKKVAVIGSIEPWIEAILLNLQNVVTTVEYNVPKINHEKLNAIHYDEFVESENVYDVIVSFSSIEHSGLGRYGDPLDPSGDIKTLNAIYTHLKTEGILIIGFPVGADALVWNLHRIYGKIRLPILFEKFYEIEWIGGIKDELLNKPLTRNADYQPIIVLKKK